MSLWVNIYEISSELPTFITKKEISSEYLPSLKELIQAFPELENLIIDSREGFIESVEFIAKDNGSLTEAEKIIRDTLEKFSNDTFGGHIRQENTKSGNVLEISFSALHALKKYCTDMTKKSSTT